MLPNTVDPRIPVVTDVGTFIFRSTDYASDCKSSLYIYIYINITIVIYNIYSDCKYINIYILIYHYTSSAIDGFIQTWNQLNHASDPQPQPATTSADGGGYEVPCGPLLIYIHYHPLGSYQYLGC